jgi:mono/diheme cytochrome c family protein
MVRTERARWGLCFGALAAMISVGAGVAMKPAPAHAQTRTPVQIFDRACGRCHGAEGNDPEEDTPRIKNKRLAVAKMTGVIRNGRGDMKAIPPTKLSDADLASLMTYLRQIHAVR